MRKRRIVLALILAIGLVIPSPARASNRTLIQQKRVEARELSKKINRLFPDSEYRLQLEQKFEKLLEDIKNLRRRNVVSNAIPAQPQKESLPKVSFNSSSETNSSPSSSSVQLTSAQRRTRERRKRLKLSPVRILRSVVVESKPENKVYHGEASYYADFFNGKNTASGSTFSNSDLTAAHRTLSFGSTVRVTSKASGKSVVVTITDRGPYVDGRIIDLTSRAFSALEPLSRGVINVEMEILEEVE